MIAIAPEITRTKKALVPVENGEIVGRRAFALPQIADGRPILVGIPGNSPCTTAAVVYTGHSLSPEDVLSRVGMDAVCDAALAQRYLTEVARFKVGDYVRVDPDAVEMTLVQVARQKRTGRET